ncbi:hypothetical protein D9757_013400 [Collybiopsis confluens]|uniref:Uncharacterized protein n=1 Tax=Collybiopsis confluens TaxID=2823264 RepID=A0A8H5FS08_9AGAR|nr:hypothetical protein D9757_013400 [Collybiopsis confluens]
MSMPGRGSSSTTVTQHEEAFNKWLIDLKVEIEYQLFPYVTCSKTILERSLQEATNDREKEQVEADHKARFRELVRVAAAHFGLAKEKEKWRFQKCQMDGVEWSRPPTITVICPRPSWYTDTSDINTTSVLSSDSDILPSESHSPPDQNNDHDAPQSTDQGDEEASDGFTLVSEGESDAGSSRSDGIDLDAVMSYFDEADSRLDIRELDLQNREEQVVMRDSSIDAKDAELARKEEAVLLRELEVDRREQELGRLHSWQQQLGELEQQLIEQREDIQAKAEQQESEQQKLEAKEAEILERGAVLEAKEAQLEQIQMNLKRREAGILDREKGVRVREESVVSKEVDLGRTEETLHRMAEEFRKKEEDVLLEHARLNDAFHDREVKVSREIERTKQMMEHHKVELDKRQKMLEGRGEALDIKGRDLQARQRLMEREHAQARFGQHCREYALQGRDEGVQKREKAVYQREELVQREEDAATKRNQWLESEETKLHQFQAKIQHEAAELEERSRLVESRLTMLGQKELAFARSCKRSVKQLRSFGSLSNLPSYSPRDTEEDDCVSDGEIANERALSFRKSTAVRTRVFLSHINDEHNGLEQIAILHPSSSSPRFMDGANRFTINAETFNMVGHSLHHLQRARSEG